MIGIKLLNFSKKHCIINDKVFFIYNYFTSFKSQQENKNGDEKSLNDRNFSYAVGQIVGSILCMVLTILEGSIFKRSSTALWIVYVGISFSVALAGLIKSKKKHLLVPLIICGLGLIWLVTIYFMGK